MSNLLELCLVTHRENLDEVAFLHVIEQSLKGGVTMVQLREKTAATAKFIEVGRALKALLDRYNIPLIINDRVDVALALGAAGVHLGQEDMKPEDARRLLGDKSIIGWSVENDIQAREAEDFPIDYIGASPVFPTSTKQDAAEPLGLEGLKRLVQISSHPVIAIGGIKITNVGEVMAAGARGVAVVSEIFKASDPGIAAKALYDKVVHVSRECI
jgi:thiamine-phosphate pyrophosphorylase